MIRQLLAATTLLAGAGVLALPSPAAAAASCPAPSINPHSNVAGQGVDNYRMVARGTLGSRTLKLMAGVRPFDSKQYGWAEISGPTAGSDSVALQISNTGGTAPFTTCGYYTVDVAGTIGFSRAKPTSPLARVVFRACGRLSSGASSCTPWW
ncbi:hypothetical protein GCM10020358_18830 [Amorphoplanes nipponensis]|uniref:Secreted protein n=1 Tax=Actinoplanes nipponensis TaxID=135950 RepID=A0A919MN08_9ACTN|nr:hypothetical protein [Actinoplanes nipponensis]GIE50467.1 hypothetical protein Ani05nite_40010 [Actinoplanes nipponensis]